MYICVFCKQDKQGGYLRIITIMDNEYITHQGKVYVNDGWDIDEYDQSTTPVSSYQSEENQTKAINIIRKLQQTK